MLLRTAEPGDARGIAVVHVSSWREAYRGLMPQHVLDALSVPDHAAGWDRILADPARRARTLVVEDGEGRIVGWASYGEAREQDAPGTGELWGIYAHPDAWSTGVGHALIAAVEEALRADGHEVAYLWVLAGNDRASGFYERHGWIADGGTKVEHRPGLVLNELRHVKRLG